MIEQSDDELYTANGLDDYDVEYIPNSYLDDNGIRHAVVWDKDVEMHYKLVNGHILLEDLVVF